MLNFVPVPVPREHVLEVMRWVLFRAEEDQSARARDSERFSAYLAAAGEDTRRLLELLATATLDRQPLRLRDAADLLDLDRDSFQALFDAVHDEALEEGREVFEVSTQPAATIDGRPGTAQFIALREDLARLVRAQATQEGR